MPPKLKKTIFIMVANIGSTSVDESSEQDHFINKTKYAMKLALQKRIFVQPKDKIGIITMGEEISNFDGLQNIKMYSEHLQVPNWEMVKYIDQLVCQNYPCNWIEGLFAGLSYIEKEDLNPKDRCYIVIFNNFMEKNEVVEEYDLHVITNELNNHKNLLILFVGEKNFESLSTPACKSEKYVLKFLKKINAQYQKINEFIETAQFFQPPNPNIVSWKFSLQWGNLKIPCASYIKLAHKKNIGPWRMHIIRNSQDPLGRFGNVVGAIAHLQFHKVINIVKENITVDNRRNEIKPENIIFGYKFGGKYIPISEEDEMTMKNFKTKKGMLIYGFVPQNEVKLEYWSGTGTRIIVPSQKMHSEKFYSLVKAMIDKKYAAIVRKVYNNNNAPKMGVLFPKMDDDFLWCLVHLEIPYVKNVRIIKKRPIRSIEKIVNQKKLEVIENYIDSMTISETDLESRNFKYLNIGMFPNVQRQYQLNALANRALNPKQPLVPLNYLKHYLEPPEHLCAKAQPYVEKLKEFFVSNMRGKGLSAKKSTFSKVFVKNVTTETKNSNDEPFFPLEDVDWNMEELDDM